MMHELTPGQIVSELDKFIIGQTAAKRAVAIAVRNRWRRRQLPESLAHEVHPRNIIMIGPTGVGKTEIARRLARLVDAPFIKIEATKFTEVGYHGRDVDSIIRDLLDLAINMVRAEQSERVSAKAEAAVEERLLTILMGSAGVEPLDLKIEVYDQEDGDTTGIPEAPESSSRARMRQKLRAGGLDDREIELTVREHSVIPMIGGMGPDQLDPAMASMLEQIMPAKSKQRRATIAEARNLLREEEVDKLIDHDAMIETAIERTEQSGIVFLDEIDKIASGNGMQQADVSRQGVQRDLLPIVEGSTVTTRHGLVSTDHILFIAAGAFHSTTVSDLMPELQGRFPIRVELDALTRGDLLRILREPEHSLLKQQQALLATEGMQIDIDDDAVEVMADYAAQANATLEDIGARRLMTIVERLFEKISFDAPDMVQKRDFKVRISAEDVRNELRQILDSEDLSRFVL